MNEHDLIESFLTLAQQQIKDHPAKVPVNSVFALATLLWLRKRLARQYPLEPPQPEPVAPPPKKSGRPKKSDKRARFISTQYRPSDADPVTRSLEIRQGFLPPPSCESGGDPDRLRWGALAGFSGRSE
jgi:hypothetical protein